MTTIVVLYTSFREGQVTFLTSARTSLKKWTQSFVPSNFLAHLQFPLKSFTCHSKPMDLLQLSLNPCDV